MTQKTLTQAAQMENGAQEYQIDTPLAGKPLWDELRSIPRLLPPRDRPFFVEDGRFVSLYDDEGALCWVLNLEDGTTYHSPFDKGPAIKLLPKVEQKRLRAQAKPAKRVSKVYFIGDPQIAIKIGYSVCVSTRFQHLQAASPVRLQILATVQGGERDEAVYHTQFAEHRLHGEWFAPHPDILAEIERLKETANA